MTITTAAAALSDRERLVLGLYFLEDQTQRPIARKMSVSQMQVSRILRSTLERRNQRDRPLRLVGVIVCVALR